MAAFSHVAFPTDSGLETVLFRLHPERAVETHDFAVQIIILDHGHDQMREFGGLTETRGIGIARPSAAWASCGSSASSGVLKRPGAIVSTRIPKRASSRATGSVSAAMPPFDAA
jgi:hypothetical protein